LFLGVKWETQGVKKRHEGMGKEIFHLKNNFTTPKKKTFVQGSKQKNMTIEDFFLENP
jgi:hypothetical protein